MAAKVGKSIQVNEALERMRGVLRGNKKVHRCRMLVKPVVNPY